VITVVAGKPTELAFTVSRFSLLPPGTIVFRIRNAGASFHDFVLCEYPVANASRNSCAGYQSRDLQPGEATTITIRSIKKGTYEFLSTDPGDAAGGMKGLLGVGVAVTRIRPTPTPASPKPSSVSPTSAPTQPLPAATTAAPPAAATTTTQSGGYICKMGHLVQGVSTPDLCEGTEGDQSG